MTSSLLGGFVNITLILHPETARPRSGRTGLPSAPALWAAVVGARSVGRAQRWRWTTREDGKNLISGTCWMYFYVCVFVKTLPIQKGENLIEFHLWGTASESFLLLVIVVVDVVDDDDYDDCCFIQGSRRLQKVLHAPRELTAAWECPVFSILIFRLPSNDWLPQFRSNHTKIHLYLPLQVIRLHF